MRPEPNSLSTAEGGPPPAFPLCVFTPELGIASQTFIKRHIELLMPGETAVVTERIRTRDGVEMSRYLAVLELGRIPVGRAQRVVAFGARHIRRMPLGGGIREARSFLRQHGVAVIMGEHLDTSLPLLAASRGLGLRFFAHAHGHDVSMRLNDGVWRKRYLAYNRASGIITMSEVSRDRLIRIGLDASRIHVIPYGVDVPPAHIERQDDETVRCLAVGRMVEKKGPVLLLDAFRRALETHPMLHLDYVGAGPLLPAAEHFVRAFSLEQKVTLHGEVSNAKVLELMVRADIFVHHAITSADGNAEGLPVAVLEAMANSLPVVATRHEGIPEAVSHGVSGMLVNDGDTRGMAADIALLSGNAPLRRSMGKEAWSKARSSFSWELERDRLRRLLSLNPRRDLRTR